MNKKIWILGLIAASLVSCGGTVSSYQPTTTTTHTKTTYVPPEPDYTFVIDTTLPFRYTYFGSDFEVTKCYVSYYYLYKSDQGAKAGLAGKVDVVHAGKRITGSDSMGMFTIKTKNSAGQVVTSTTQNVVTPNLNAGESYADTTFSLIYSDGLPKGKYTLSLINW
jgi:hypothetical protein